jgi:hypothetical protein
MSDLNQVAPKKIGTDVAVSRAVQEVQAAVVLAKQYPREQQESCKRILLACQRPGLAEQAIYSYPKGGQNVTGPSIRLAEAMAREWGNLQYGIVEQDREGDTSSMLAYAWDLETNVMARLEYKVKLYRDSNSKGKQLMESERDIYETVANQGSRRLRACILKMIPGDVVEQAEAECNRTLKAQVTDIPDATRKMVAAFQEIGVTKQMIEKRFGHNIEATSAAEIISMKKVYASIKDEMGDISDFFKPDADAATPTTVAEKAKAAALGAVKKPAAATQPTSAGKTDGKTVKPCPKPQQSSQSAETDETGIPAGL